ncbi:hypothetical protein MSKU15_1973 [Komagataeibacter diospyri]|nr:hypothetical protein MSKU15_1973 [Komagataeibacter diospyri]
MGNRWQGKRELPKTSVTDPSIANSLVLKLDDCFRWMTGAAICSPKYPSKSPVCLRNVQQTDGFRLRTGPLNYETSAS